MRPEIKLSESYGKTIEAVSFGGYGGQAVVTFTDGTFSTLGIDRGYDGDAEIVEEELELFDYGDSALIRLGVVTLEELRALRKVRDDKGKRYREEQERRQFAILKEKFAE